MISYLLLVVAIIAFTISEVSEYKKFHQFLDEFQTNSKKTLTVTKISMWTYFFTLGLGSISTIIAILLVLNPQWVSDEQYLMDAVAFAALAFLFFSAFFLSKHKFVLYYDLEGFVNNNRYIKYGSIRSINKKSKNSTKHEIHLYNGEKIELTNGLSEIIKVELEKVKSAKKEKKNR